MKANTNPLLPEHYYHIYNRGINGCPIFQKDAHYKLFLTKYAYHVNPFINTFVYCLLGNHFHLLIQVKSEEDIIKSVNDRYPGKQISSIEKIISSQFAHLFNGYCQSFNKDTNRTGGLFESPFRRIEVDSDAYFTQLIAYIHRNPQKHKLINDFRNYNYSSYQSHLSKSSTQLKREYVLKWFGGITPYREFHENQNNPQSNISKYIIEVD